MSLSILLIFVIICNYTNGNSFTCNDTNPICRINCTLTPTLCSNSIINSGNAKSLDIECNGSSICSNLTINCPHLPTNFNKSITNTADCKLNCDGNNACNNIQFNTLTANSSISCGNGSQSINAKKAICSNIIIQSTSKSLNTSFVTFKSKTLNYTNITSSQYINLTCISVIDDVNGNTATCTNITFQNLANDENVTWSFRKYMIINCDASDMVSNNSVNHACNNFIIKDNPIPLNLDISLNFIINNTFGINNLTVINTISDTFNIINYDQMSDIFIPSQSINALNIYNDINGMITKMYINNTINTLLNQGIIEQIDINQFENITIGSTGYLGQSNISSLNLQNIINIHSNGKISNCDFKLFQDINHTNNTLQLWHDGSLMNNTINIHGSVNIIVNGLFQWNLINLTKIYDYAFFDDKSSDFMNVMIMRLNESSQWMNNTIYAYYTDVLDIKTASLFSGWIYTNHSCNNFSLQCSNHGTNIDELENSCSNLTLYTSSTNYTNNNKHDDYDKDKNKKEYPTNLICDGYGCQYLSIFSKYGLNDIYVTAPKDCPCTIDCIDNCMGDWNIYCSNESNNKYDIHALFSNDECNSTDYCCGKIVNKSEEFFVCSPNIYDNVVCKHSVGLDIAVIASLAMAGVIIFFFLFLLARYIYRKFKNTTAKQELRKKRQMEHNKSSKKDNKNKNKHKRKHKSQRLKTIETDDNKTTNLLNSDNTDHTKTPSTPITVN